ncbi:MAG: hypothetical protein VZQ51_06070, partial [Bacteroidales bacterium]|nr:hypothetical protein [Bacteroidales bacterium]
MKKLFLSLLTVLSAATFYSCEGDQGPMGPAGPAGKDGLDGENGLVYYQKTDFTVESADWQLRAPDDKPNERYYRYEFDYNEITDEMCDIGIISAYFVYDDGYQNPLTS